MNDTHQTSTTAPDVAYCHTQGEWTVTGSYDGPDNIVIRRNGELVRSLTVPGYKIWNYAAHLSDIVAELTAAESPAEDACVVCGEQPNGCDCPNRNHPDYDPTDADLAPRWDAIPVDEQHAIAGRIKTALKDGAL